MAVYDFTKLQPSPSNNSKFGTFWLYAKLDFSKQHLGIADSAKIIKLMDKWIVRDSYWRMHTASTAANTFDIGYVLASTYASTTTGIKASASSAAGNWIQGTIDPDANQLICAADYWIFVENLGAIVYDGILEVMVEVVAGPDDQRMPGMTSNTDF